MSNRIDRDGVTSVTQEGRRSTHASSPVLRRIETTRSIHRFKPDPVTDDQLRTLLYAASRAPSGSNLQPYRFLVLREGSSAQQAKALLGTTYRQRWKAKADREGFSLSQRGDGSTRRTRTADAMAKFVANFENIPVVVLACLDRVREANPREGASIYPACQNMLLMAAELGLGGTITLWHEEVEDELKAMLGIPSRVGISAIIPLGYPEGQHGPLRRRPLQETVFQDRWGCPPQWAVEQATRQGSASR